MNSNKLKSITLVEPFVDGHHLTYLEAFVEVLQKKGFRVTVFSMDEKAVENLQNVSFYKLKYYNRKRLPANIILKLLVISLNLINVLRNIYSIRKGNTEKQTLFFCTLDDYLHEFLPAWVFNKLLNSPFSGLLLSVPFNRKRQFLKYSTLISPKCLGVGVLTKSENFLFGATKIIDFPDFANFEVEKTLPKCILDIQQQKSSSQITISLLGEISERKGLFILMDIIEKTSRKDFFFIIAGGLSDSISEEQKRKIELFFSTKKNCFYYPTRIKSEGIFNLFIKETDIIYAFYKGFQQSSNMLAKSCLFQKPLIVNEYSLYMSEQVQKWGLGIAVNQETMLDLSKIAETLKYNFPFDKTDFSGYLKKNRIEELEKSFELILK